MQIAQDFFAGKGKSPQLSVVPHQKVEAQIRKRVAAARKVPAQNQGFYVVNDETNNRFVIVSADERLYIILGYSDSGCFEPENVSDGLMALMSGYNTEYNYVVNNSQTTLVSSPEKENANPILPLIKTKWGQGTPFNYHCPLSSHGSKSVSGCVATAMAQVLYYYGQPSQGQGGLEKYTTRSTNTMQSINYDTLTIDWSKIKDTYRYYIDENGRYQSVPDRADEENNEVAKLMHACGVSVFMDYDTGSGAFPSDVPYALIKHFGYNPNTVCVRRECYSNKEWNNMIMEELNAQRPVIYGGQDGEYGGHEFIIDGINDEGLYHINFGWFGSDDGYYSIDAIDPDIYKFHLDHDMVIRVSPNFVEGEKSNIYFNQFSLSPSVNIGDSYKVNLSFKLYSNEINSQNFNFDGNVGVGVFDKDWNLVNSLYEFRATNLSTTDKKLMQPQYVYWPQISNALESRVNFAESIFGKDETQLYIAPYAIINSTVVRGRHINGEKNWYRATTWNGKVILEPDSVIEGYVLPIPPVEYDTIPDWLVGTYNVNALDNYNLKTSVWQVSLVKDEVDSTKCWFYNIDKKLMEKGFPSSINKVSGYMGKDGRIRIPSNQDIGNEYWLKNFQTTDSIIVAVSKTNNSMDISDAWGVSNKSTGEILSRYIRSHFSFAPRDTIVATPFINVSEDHYMTISCSTKDVVIKYTYTRSGEEPTNNSIEYSGRVLLDKNGIVKAIAYKNGLSSEVATVEVTSFKVAKPEIHQEGNHITFTCATDGATIYYDWDGKTRQTGSIDIEKSGVIKVYAEKDDFNSSDIMELSLVYTPMPDPDPSIDDNYLNIANNEAGKLSTRISDTEKLSATRLTISGEINGTDIAFIRGMFMEGKLTDLDIENASIVSGGELYDEYWEVGTKDNVVGKYMFEDCKQMISIKLPSNAVKIEGGAFKGCKSLKRLDIPVSCIEVESMILSSCANLEEVNLSDAVQKFPGLAVYSCNNLMKINASENNPYFKSVDGVLFSKDGKILVRYPMGKNDVAYTIPDGVVTIGKEAFDYAKIASITIPNTVTTIESSAFENCKNILTLAIPNSVTTIGSSAFTGCSKLDNVTMSSEVTSIESFTFGGCQNLRKFYIGEKVDNIDKLAFYNCKSLQEFVVDENSNSFTTQFGILYTKDMQELVKCPMALYSEECIVPNSVKVIRSEAFATCTNIKKFYLPETLTTIGECAFENCEMASIKIPQSVTFIGSSAFNKCNNLETMVLPEGTGKIENMTLHGCKSLSYVYIPAGVKSFGMWAIADCKLLTMINSQIKDVDDITVYYDKTNGYYDSFENIPDTCTWRVPSGPVDNLDKYVNKYKAQPWWVPTWRIVRDGEPEKENSIEITLSSELQTFCSDKNLDFTNIENLKAYIASGVDPKTNDVILSHVNIVPAKTGILLIGKAGQNYEVPFADADFIYSNLFRGLLEDVEVTSGYVLDADRKEFVAVDGTVTVKGGEAYLNVEPVVNASRLTIRFTDTITISGIDDILLDAAATSGAWYTLQGIRLNGKPGKPGIYVHQGRKVVVK